MHVHTHLMSGWIVGSLPDLRARERFLCMVAAAAPDLDGLGVLVSERLYWDWHHVLCHNALAAFLISGILAAFSVRRPRAFLLYLACFHLHLVLDYWGSGPGWEIYYFWPFSIRGFLSPNAWPLSSWQNAVAGGLCLAWTLGIALRQGRTPLECWRPAWDAKAVEGIRSLWRRFRRA